MAIARKVLEDHKQVTRQEWISVLHGRNEEDTVGRWVRGGSEAHTAY
jgi:hypothetical protein